MRKLTYYIALSIDGFIAGPDDEVDFFPGSDEYMTWMVDDYGDALPGHFREQFGRADAALTRFDTIVMGRRTYDPALQLGITSPYPHLRQYVVSRSLEQPDPAVTVVADDVVETVRALKAEDSPLEARPAARDGYANAKLWQERLCRRYAAAHGWRLTVLRPGFIWSGERPWIDGIGIRLGPLLVVNGPWRRLPLTHVENCAECIALSVDCGAAANETINIIDADDGRAWSLAGDLMRRGAAPVRWRVAIPYHAGLGLSMAASAVGRVLLGPRVRLPGVLAPARYRARFRSLKFPNGKARRLLGWQPQPRSGDLPGPAIARGAEA